MSAQKNLLCGLHQQLLHVNVTAHNGRNIKKLKERVARMIINANCVIPAKDLRCIVNDVLKIVYDNRTTRKNHLLTATQATEKQNALVCSYKINYSL